MKQKTLLAICIVSLFCFAECRKHRNIPPSDNPYGLPNATQTGAGVFVCRINGMNLIGRDDIYHQAGRVKNDTLGVLESFIYGRFFILINFGVFNNPQTNITYNLSDSTNTFCLIGTDSTCSAIGSVSNFYPKIGTFTITKLDTTHPYTSENTISGTFSFKVPISGCDTLNVTDGRFDLKY